LSVHKSPFLCAIYIFAKGLCKYRAKYVKDTPIIENMVKNVKDLGYNMSFAEMATNPDFKNCK
jgi:hypothetical protein